MKTVYSSIDHVTAGRNVKTVSTFRNAGTIVVYLLVFCIALPAFLFATGLRLDQLWPAGAVSGAGTSPVGSLLVGAGLSIILAAIVQLRITGRGLPISHLPPTRLVVNGVFRYVRHPIYVGYTMAFAGTSLLVGSFWSFAFSTPLLLLSWIAYALYAEEPVLIQRFGSDYLEYRRRTRLIWPFERERSTEASGWTLGPSFWHVVNRVANRTILIQIGDLILVTYGVLCAVGAFVVAAWLAAALRQQGVPHAHGAQLLVGTALSACILGWSFWWAGNWRRLIRQRWWGIGQVGFVSYGGLAGAMVFPFVFAVVTGYSPLMLLDCISLGLYWAYAIGRLGCLSFGCCYGRPGEHGRGVVYENPHAKVIRAGDHRRVARRPTQLYSFAHGVVLVLILNAMTWGAIPAGLVTAVGLMLVGLGRTFTEAYRDRERPVFGRFTHGQLGSWVTFALGWVVLWLMSPAVDGTAPKPLTPAAFANSADLLPFVLVASLIVLIIAGLHWKRVGTWVG